MRIDRAVWPEIKGLIGLVVFQYPHGSALQIIELTTVQAPDKGHQTSKAKANGEGNEKK